MLAAGTFKAFKVVWNSIDKISILTQKKSIPCRSTSLGSVDSYSGLCPHVRSSTFQTAPHGLSHLILFLVLPLGYDNRLLWRKCEFVVAGRRIAAVFGPGL